MSCAVKCCRNYKSRRPEGISFYRFPRDKNMKSIWIRILDLGKDWICTPNKYVCSQHFKVQDYTHQLGRGRRALKRSAVPSLLLSGPDPDLQSQIAVLRSCQAIEFVVVLDPDPSGIQQEMSTLEIEHDNSGTNSGVYETDIPKRKLSISSDTSAASTDNIKLRRLVEFIECIHSYSKVPAKIEAKYKALQIHQQQYRNKLNRANKKIKSLKKEVTSLKSVIDFFNTALKYDNSGTNSGVYKRYIPKRKLSTSSISATNTVSSTKRRKLVESSDCFPSYSISPTNIMTKYKELQIQQEEYRKRQYRATKKIKALKEKATSLKLVVNSLRKQICSKRKIS